MMPHLVGAFYQNLITANLQDHDLPDSLSNLTLVANNFQNIEANTMKKEMREHLRVLFSILSRTTVHPLPAFDACPTAFNDIAIHTFSPIT